MPDYIECFRPVAGKGSRFYHLYANEDHDDDPCNEAHCGVEAPWHDAENDNWNAVGDTHQCPHCRRIAQEVE